MFFFYIILQNFVEFIIKLYYLLFCLLLFFPFSCANIPIRLRIIDRRGTWWLGARLGQDFYLIYRLVLILCVVLIYFMSPKLFVVEILLRDNLYWLKFYIVITYIIIDWIIIWIFLSIHYTFHSPLIRLVIYIT